MRLTEYIRSVSFWVIDFLKGSPIKSHYSEIQGVLSNPLSVESMSIKKTRLDSLLNHATLTTQFYKKFTSRLLKDFPIISKNDILENFNAFESNLFKPSQRLKITTSGSTGIPLKIWHNKNKKNRNTADTICFSELGNYSLGRTLVFIKLWDKKSYKNLMTLWKQNIIKHNVLDTSEKEISQFLQTLLKDNSQKTIIGYPSFFEQVCKYIEKTKIDLKSAKVKSIISIAETLSEYERNGMATHFKAPVYNRYSNQENGILAQQTINSQGKYLVNTASYYVELLHPQKNEPVKAGNIGRIVVTDLFNYAMPLIRYDTGDMAISSENGECISSFNELFGRHIDMIYDTSENMVSPHIFYHVSQFSKHKQFQFIQLTKQEYCFKLNATKEQTEEQKIVNYYKTYLGNDAIITFKYVNEIPVLNSGKRKKVQNNYKKTVITQLN